MKKIKFGDIFDAEKHDAPLNFLIHGCNAQGVMGSGLAVQVKHKFFNAYAAYKNSVDRLGAGNPELLGSISTCAATGNPNLIIVNAITQLDFGRGPKRYVSYEAVQKAFDATLLSVVEVMNERKAVRAAVHYPLIGAGLGGGDWSIISEIIDTSFSALKGVSRPEIEQVLWIQD